MPGVPKRTRAAGIHLIVATQRSSIDSGVILDMVGVEKFLGKVICYLNPWVKIILKEYRGLMLVKKNYKKLSISLFYKKEIYEESLTAEKGGSSSS